MSSASNRDLTELPNARHRTVWRRALATLGAVALIAALVVPGMRGSVVAARRNGCTCHGKQLGIALQNYHDVYKSFPPAYVADENGRPMHSWRVLILPFMEGQQFFSQYRFDEPWNGPNNSKLAARFDSSIYRCPAADGDPSETCYVAVVGPETMWPGARATTIGDVRDGTSQTIALVEVVHSGIHWMEPRDLTIEQALAGINPNDRGAHISSNHPGGAHVICGNANVSFIPNGLSTNRLRALLTASGGEHVEIPED